MRQKRKIHCAGDSGYPICWNKVHYGQQYWLWTVQLTAFLRDKSIWPLRCENCLKVLRQASANLQREKRREFWEFSKLK